jgi:hypothetical protein
MATDVSTSCLRVSIHNRVDGVEVLCNERELAPSTVARSAVLENIRDTGGAVELDLSDESFELWRSCDIFECERASVLCRLLKVSRVPIPLTTAASLCCTATIGLAADSRLPR